MNVNEINKRKCLYRREIKNMKIDRLFSIVQILINKKTVTAKYLADKFGVSIRTIYRDIEDLSANGIPVYSIQGKGGGISILDNYSIDKTLVSDEEQDKILMALQSVNATGQIDVKDSLIKLKNVFKKDDTDWIQIDFSGWEQSEEEKKNFELIKKSIMDVKCIKFLYYSNKGESLERIIEPYKLIFKGSKWYIYGYCKKRKDFRFFKLTRIDNIHILEEGFKKRKEGIVNTQYNEEEKKDYIDVKLKVNMSAASRVYDEFRKGIIRNEGDFLIVKFRMPKYKWLYNYFIGFGEELEILEPEYMRKEFKQFIENILNKY